MDIKVDNQIFEIVPDEARLAAEYIHKVWIGSGRPNRLEGESAWKVMDSLFQIWGACFPQELLDFKQTIQEDQALERSVHDANKADGGYFPISYPMRLMQFMKVYFPNERFQDHNLILKLVRRYPMLKVTKHKI